jgi:hypothetical protein
MNRTAEPTNGPMSNHLAAPWGTRLLPAPSSGTVSFAAIPACCGAGADLAQRLVHPWDGMRVPVPTHEPVSFESLAAPCRPVLPIQRPGSADLLPRQPLLGN